ncbi:MAG: hypothetical protein AUF64_02265 [Chloroflexi bacterium 13_1_20CM_54_36]|nr:MAG: hypothetical protein AUH05_20280 [Ktedonobacter sp. 13_2_20CM_53_11]OLD84279.1 MAG: hypothetical protein AUF64_02265 [Chloroflexi bacterium 13_1_20CM_54_36]OLE33718.1 MAG: hypothetical protein AUG45_06445 [Ktedonobacter sp. 13_1_20CM_3_54_15]
MTDAAPFLKNVLVLYSVAVYKTGKGTPLDFPRIKRKRNQPKNTHGTIKRAGRSRILTRKVFPGFPLHVEYFATERGKVLGNVIRAMDEWGEKA